MPNLLFDFGAASAPAHPGIRHFARFGVTEAMLRETLAAALSGREYADVYFQHRLSSSLSSRTGP